MARAMDPLSRDIRGIKRVQVNRKMIDEIHLGFADGLFELAQAVVYNAEPPVVTGALRDSGGAAAWADGKKVAEMPRRDRQRINAPRGAGIRSGTIIAVGGYGSRHAHLVEFGTVHARPHPFFTPAILGIIPQAVSFVSLGLAKRAYLRDTGVAANIREARFRARSGTATREHRRELAAYNRIARLGRR